MNILKAEFLKLTYQRRTWGLLAAAIFLSVLGTALSPYALVRLGHGAFISPLTLPDVVDSVYSKSLGAYILALVVGIVVMSSEFQHHTAIATFLANPKRIKVLVGKLVTAAVWGAGVNLVATGVGLLSGVIALSFYKDAAAPHSYIFVNYLLAAVLIGAVIGVVGAAIGTLIRNQNAAVSIGLVWFLVVDRILAVVWPEGGKYLPSGLITGMMQLKLHVSDKTSGLGINTADYLGPWASAGLLLAYGLVFAAVAIFTSLRRDID